MKLFSRLTDPIVSRDGNIFPPLMILHGKPVPAMASGMDGQLEQPQDMLSESGQVMPMGKEDPD